MDHLKMSSVIITIMTVGPSPGMLPRQETPFTCGILALFFPPYSSPLLPPGHLLYPSIPRHKLTQFVHRADIVPAQIHLEVRCGRAISQHAAVSVFPHTFCHGIPCVGSTLDISQAWGPPKTSFMWQHQPANGAWFQFARRKRGRGASAEDTPGQFPLPDFIFAPSRVELLMGASFVGIWILSPAAVDVLTAGSCSEHGSHLSYLTMAKFSPRQKVRSTINSGLSVYQPQLVDDNPENINRLPWQYEGQVIRGEQ